MLDKLQRALIFLSGRTDLIVAILMLVAIAMIIIPLPTWLVDVLIAVNIMLSMLVLLVVFYIERPVEFSSFPSVILILTLFRLAITITTARLILLQADAGEIVSAFGTFVVGGDIAVEINLNNVCACTLERNISEKCHIICITIRFDREF